MDDLKDLLEKNLEVSEKSLKILKKMHRAETRRTIFNALKWMLIIGLTVYSFLQIQPYLKSWLQAYQTILNTAGSINKLLPK
jgi:ferric-dicitrate binding protein FerR (iron transport regulator)